MTGKINDTMTLGEIAAKYPFAVPVLNTYKLDYCCGGKDTLAEASRRAGLDLTLITDELAKKIDKAHADGAGVKDWRRESIPELVDHILRTHHVFMKETLAELNVLLVKILEAHFDEDSTELLETHRLFNLLKSDLEAHLIKEEVRLFPMILEFDRTGDQDLKRQIDRFVDETEGEHVGAGELFEKLNEATNGYEVPNHACGSYRRAFALLDDLEKDTYNHIHLENTVLFGKLG